MNIVFRCAVSLITLIAALSISATSAAADSIELQGVVPDVDEDITPPDNAKAGEENFYTFWFKGQIGTEYQANFTVSEEPAFTFVSGGSMTTDTNTHYDPDTSTFTITYTAEALQQIDSETELDLEEGQTLTIVAVSFPVAEGETGPGENVIGSWLSTNFQEWSLLTPTENSNTMGAQVEGDPGDSGQFTMFMAQTALNTMTEYDGAEAGEYAADDFAVYEDSEPVNEDIETVTGGVLIDFTTTLPEESADTNVLSSPYAQSVTQRITVAPREAITFSANKAKVEKGGFAKFKGRIKSRQKGERIILQSRTLQSKYAKVDSTKTTSGGKFTFKIRVNKKMAFRAKYKSDTSDPVQVKVK